MAAYVIGRVTIHDPSWIENYIPKVQAQVDPYGGRYLVRNTEVDQLEGGVPPPSVAVVLEFPSIEDARAWYGSEEYKPYLNARRAGATEELLLIDGL
jgi:uncharacterized protein (DUF1330 family)